MRPLFMKQASIDSIHADFDECKKRYMSGDRQWFQTRLNREHGLAETRFDFPDFELTQGAGLGTEEEYSETDTINARVLFEAMRTLPPQAASDERLWAGLAHSQLWDFVRYRRRNDLAGGKDKAIRTSYFFTYDARRSSRVNCLARLWWAGWLTYDPDNTKDPLALTSLLTERAFSSRILLFAYSFTGNHRIALGILDAIARQRDAGVELRREHFVGPNIYLNRISGITLLDTFGRQGICDLVSEYFETDEFKSYKA